MRPADAHTGAGTGAAAPPDASGVEDTLELRLTEELLALLADSPSASAPGPTLPICSAVRAPGAPSPRPPGCSNWSRWSSNATSG